MLNKKVVLDNMPDARIKLTNGIYYVVIRINDKDVIIGDGKFESEAWMYAKVWVSNNKTIKP